MMNIKIKNRFQASSVHLAISIFIFLVFLSVMFIWWYPSPYFKTEAGWDVLGILIAVDIVLGPLLTLVVFKRGKPSLKFDLSVIACVQVAALIYGGQIIYEQRPIFLIFAQGQSYLASTNNVDMSQVDKSFREQMGGKGPFSVYAKMPDSPEAQMNLLVEQFTAGKPGLEFRPEYYESVAPNIEEIMSTDKGIKFYFEKNKNQQALKVFMSKHVGSLDKYAYFPLVGRGMLLVVNKLDAEVIDVLEVDLSPKPN